MSWTATIPNLSSDTGNRTWVFIEPSSTHLAIIALTVFDAEKYEVPNPEAAKKL